MPDEKDGPFSRQKTWKTCENEAEELVVRKSLKTRITPHHRRYAIGSNHFCVEAMRRNVAPAKGCSLSRLEAGAHRLFKRAIVLSRADAASIDSFESPPIRS